MNCLFMLILLTGCQSKTSDASKDNKSQSLAVMSDSDEYILGEDGCNTLMLYDVETAVIPSENGYYFAKNGMLCFYDKEMDKSIYVCSKADCQHEKYDENCDAFIDYTNGGIYYYKNHIYLLRCKYDTNTHIVNYYLVKCSEDGSEQQDLYNFMQYIDEEGVSYVSYVHRGYFYYSVLNEDTSKKSKATLYRRLLEKDAKEEIVYQSEGYGASLYRLTAYGNDMYIDEGGFTDASEEETYSNIVKCNIHTKKTEIIRENCYGNFVKIKDKMYIKDKEKNKIVQFSENEKEEKEIYAIENLESTDLKTDGTYLYLDISKPKEENGEKKRYHIVEIIDTEGNLVDTLENTDEFIGGDENYLFFKKCGDEYSEEVGEEVYMEHIYYYDKSNIGSGDYSLLTEMKPE